MTITLVNFLQKVSILLGDHLSSTTTSAGNAGGTTFIDSSLMKYPDGYFGNPERDPEYWFYSGTTLRPVKSFSGGTGTGTLHNAFGSQIASSTAYSLHKYNRDKKILACNQALIECYPDFYKRVEDATTLDGKGSSDNKYTVPATFTEFPDQIWKHHTGDTTTLFGRTQITDFIYENIGGVWYFYANITEGDDIYLLGKTYLSQFTNDASTTELSTGQANTVAYLAAAIFYEDFLDIIGSEDSGRFEALARKRRDKYQELANKNRMPITLSPKLGFDWMA